MTSIFDVKTIFERKIEDPDLTWALAELENGNICIYDVKKAILKWVYEIESQRESEGAKYVPIIPTDEMIEEGLKVGRTKTHLTGKRLLKARFSAMAQSAPISL